MVSRFTFTLGHDPEWDAPCVNKVPHASGGFVRHSDYEALRAELEQVKRNNIGLHDEVQFMRNAAKENREAAERLAGALEVADIESVARKAADAVGVTPHSDVRPFVEQAVKYALSALASHPCEPNPVVSHETANVRDKPDTQRIDAIADFAEPAGEVEPVAWQRLHPTEGWIWVRPEDTEHYTKMGQAIRPLYTTPPDASAIREALERGQAFANQVRAVTCHLNGQAYSSTVSALNYFDAALSRAAPAGAKP